MPNLPDDMLDVLDVANVPDGMPDVQEIMPDV